MKNKSPVSQILISFDQMSERRELNAARQQSSKRGIVYMPATLTDRSTVVKSDNRVARVISCFAQCCIRILGSRHSWTIGTSDYFSLHETRDTMALPNLRRLFVEARTEAEENEYSRNAVSSTSHDTGERIADPKASFITWCCSYHLLLYSA